MRRYYFLPFLPAHLLLFCSIAPTTRIDSGCVGCHSLWLMFQSPSASCSIEALQEWLGLFRCSSDQFRIPFLHRLDRPRPSRSITELDQLSRQPICIRVRGMEHSAWNDDCRSGFQTQGEFFRVGFVAHVRTCLRVKGEMAPRNKPKRCPFLG